MRMRRIVAVAGAVLALSALAVLGGAYLLLRASLPQLEGARRQGELHAPVRITRDWRGVPTIEAADRVDLAYATGFLHAQDRFFQMDLSRRLAAGELAELFGPVALDEDRETRVFRFRSVARAVLAAAQPAERAVLEAYTRGVNAGLGALGARPWEYWVLGQPPAPWRAEDTVLVVYSMWWDLQANGFRREILRHEINARLQGPECAAGWKCALSFLYPRGTSWDAPVLPSSEAQASEPVPDPSVLDMRASTSAARPPAPPRHTGEAGSNNWALAGRLTASGAALVANDMHLGQRVPTVWYHARLKLTSRGGEAGLDLNGVTLPGTPLLVAGSNGHIAWGFTNSYGTWLEVQALPCVERDGQRLTSGQGELALTVASERIRVHGEPDEMLAVRSGPAGLLLRIDRQEQTCWFGSWLAQLPSATNFGLIGLERASSVAQALALAPEVGIPHQNLVVGDAQGHIGWSILGRVPEELGPARARTGAPFTTAADHPQILDPPSGRLWSANARVASDARQLELIAGNLAPLGAEYDLGARAAQIRDDLLALNAPATPADMLRIQLDERALFLARWRELLLSLLDERSLAGHPRRAEFRRLVQDWNAQASVDAVGYRLVRGFRDRTEQAVWQMLLAALSITDDEDIGPPAQFEGPLWQLLSARPVNWLSRGYADWSEFLRAQLDATIGELLASCPQLAHCTWGEHNLVRIRHPLARALPWLSWFLDMPPLELPGDHDMPRVQEGAFGASERFAVSPGHESEGYLHIPGGQSGHPLSPYYRAGFTQWARGEPLPFLPGPAEHTLTLRPD
jgi:penicillin amidase